METIPSLINTSILRIVQPPPSPEGWETESDEEDGLADQDPLNINWCENSSLDLRCYLSFCHISLSLTSLSCRIVLRTYQVGICSLPGNRLGGARRSLPADLETLKKSGIQDVFVLCTDADLNRCTIIITTSRLVPKSCDPLSPQV